MWTRSARPALWLAVALLAACASPAPQAPEAQRPPASAPRTEPPPAPPLQDTRQLPSQPAPAPLEAPTLPEAPQLPVDDSVRRDFSQAVARMRDTDYTQAIELLQALHQRRPRLSEPLLNLGIAYARSDQLEKAEVALRQALQLRESATAWNQLGLVLRRRGALEAAREAYGEALALEPDHAFAHLNLGVLCELYLGDYPCALNQYRAYLESAPEDAEQVRLWLFDLERRSAGR